MPKIGEIRKASELGYKRDPRHDCLYTYTMCTKCSRTRWVRNQYLGTKKGLLCLSCAHSTVKGLRNRSDWPMKSGAKRASEIGKLVSGKKDPWYYPHVCYSCGKTTWHRRRDLHRACLKCAYTVRRSFENEAHPNWKGGRYLRSDGYVAVKVPLRDPYHPMASSHDGYILEHRLVMAQKLGRILRDSEIVHHINGNKSDNRIKNLELLPHLAAHMPYIVLQKRVYKLENTVAQQTNEIKLLKWHIRELEQANPVLSSEVQTSDKCVEAIHGTSTEDDEMVRPSGKSDE